MWNYSKEVMDHFMNPRNVGEVENPDGVGEVGNAACGDALKLTFKLDDDGKIAEVKFRTFGCASAIASTSILSEACKGMKIDEAYKLKPADIVARLVGLPANKIHCSVLGDKALRAAIDDYLTKQGRPVFAGQEEVEVICTCLNVTDRDLEEAYKAGDRTWEQLQSRFLLFWTR